MRQPQIEAQQVCVTAGQPNRLGLVATDYLLRDLSFQIYPGDRVGLVGCSGSGKSTLLRLLNRLIDPARGQLYFDQQPYLTIPPVQLRQQITLVLPETRLLGMTAQQAIAYPLQLRGWQPKAIQQRVATWLERLQIPQTWLERTEHQLSTGQRQLVSLVRALVIQPTVLLLDEPLAGLDIGQADRVLQVLMELSQTHRLTVVMANHDWAQLQAWCDRALYLKQGTLQHDQVASKVNWSCWQTEIQRAELTQATEWD